MYEKASKTVRICGVEIDNVDFKKAIDSIEIFAQGRNPVLIVTPNVDHIVRIQRDEEFKRIYKNASLILADGMPLLWAARFVGKPLKERISGAASLQRMQDSKEK